MSAPDLPPDPVLVIVSRGKPIAASSDPRALEAAARLLGTPVVHGRWGRRFLRVTCDGCELLMPIP